MNSENYCPKCGWHWATHNDDGSCVEDEVTMMEWAVCKFDNPELGWFMHWTEAPATVEAIQAYMDPYDLGLEPFSIVFTAPDMQEAEDRLAELMGGA